MNPFCMGRTTNECHRIMNTKLTLSVVSYQEDSLSFIVRTPAGIESTVPTMLFQQTQEFVNNLPESLECYVMKDGSIQQAKKQLLEQCFKKKKGHATFIVDTITDNKYQLLDFYGFSHPYESVKPYKWELGEEVEMNYDGIEACEEDNTAWLKIVEPYEQEVVIRANALSDAYEPLEHALNSRIEPLYNGPRLGYVSAINPPAPPRLRIREGVKVEFKSSFVYTQKGELNIDRQMQEIIQAIAAFMNADGGKLYLGIRDNGDVRGLEEDLPYIQTSEFDQMPYKHTMDGLKQKIYASVKWHLGEDAIDLIERIQISSPRGYRELEYVVITIQPSSHIVWYSPRGRDRENELYVRRDGMVQKYPPGNSMANFIIRRTAKMRQKDIFTFG